MKRVRVLLVDDQVLFVHNLRTVLQFRTKDIEVVDIAYNGQEAVEAVKRFRPDIVLMDVRMPVLDGVEAARIIHQRYPGTQILMLTTFDDDEYVQKALTYGAVGYLLKDIPPAELIAAVRATREGACLVSPAVIRKLADWFDVKSANDNWHSISRDTGPTWSKYLSKRERQVFELLVEGLDNTEIAGRLFIAEQTVKNHVSSIYSKIGAENRVQAIQFALTSERSR